MENRILYGVCGFAVAAALLLGFWLKFQSFKQAEYLFYLHIESEAFKEELRMNAEKEAYRAWENLKGIK